MEWDEACTVVEPKRRHYWSGPPSRLHAARVLPSRLQLPPCPDLPASRSPSSRSPPSWTSPSRSCLLSAFCRVDQHVIKACTLHRAERCDKLGRALEADELRALKGAEGAVAL